LTGVMFYFESHCMLFVVLLFFSKLSVWWHKICHRRQPLQSTTNMLSWHLDVQS